MTDSDSDLEIQEVRAIPNGADRINATRPTGIPRRSHRISSTSSRGQTCASSPTATSSRTSDTSNMSVSEPTASNDQDEDGFEIVSESVVSTPSLDAQSADHHRALMFATGTLPEQQRQRQYRNRIRQNQSAANGAPNTAQHRRRHQQPTTGNTRRPVHAMSYVPPYQLRAMSDNTGNSTEPLSSYMLRTLYFSGGRGLTASLRNGGFPMRILFSLLGGGEDGESSSSSYAPSSDYSSSSADSPSAYSSNSPYDFGSDLERAIQRSLYEHTERPLLSLDKLTRIEPPTETRKGYTRKITIHNPVVCARCNRELGTGLTEDSGDLPKDTIQQSKRVFFSKCCHAYCGVCVAFYTSGTAAKPAAAAVDATTGTQPPKRRRTRAEPRTCAVTDCPQSFARLKHPFREIFY